MVNLTNYLLLWLEIVFFGRVDKESFNPLTPEISLTPDSNGGVGNGYETGHFPPNMWEQVVAYKVLEMLQ